jgi:hypothetical protein
MSPPTSDLNRGRRETHINGFASPVIKKISIAISCLQRVGSLVPPIFQDSQKDGKWEDGPCRVPERRQFLLRSIWFQIGRQQQTLVEFGVLGRGKPSYAPCELGGGECRGGKLKAQYAGYVSPRLRIKWATLTSSSQGYRLGSEWGPENCDRRIFNNISVVSNLEIAVRTTKMSSYISVKLVVCGLLYLVYLLIK